MPVVTRDAVLRSQVTDDVDPLDEATLAATSLTKPTTKTVRKCRSKQKLKERVTDSMINCSKPESSLLSQQQSPISQTEAALPATIHPDDKGTYLNK